jgi:hypothetical protein
MIITENVIDLKNQLKEHSLEYKITKIRRKNPRRYNFREITSDERDKMKSYMTGLNPGDNLNKSRDKIVMTLYGKDRYVISKDAFDSIYEKKLDYYVRKYPFVGIIVTPAMVNISLSINHKVPNIGDFIVFVPIKFKDFEGTNYQNELKNPTGKLEIIEKNQLTNFVINIDDDNTLSYFIAGLVGVITYYALSK